MLNRHISTGLKLLDVTCSAHKQLGRTEDQSCQAFAS